MALDETQVAEQVAVEVESSAPETESHSIPVVEELTGKGREKWLKEPADFPRPPKKSAPKSSSPTDKADSSAAAADVKESDVTEDSSTSPAQGTEETAETAAESAAAEPSQSQPKGSEAEKRIKSLLSETKLLKQRLAQLEVERTAPPAQAASKPAAEGEKALERPDPSKFETLGEYFDALSDFKVESALRTERQRQAQEWEQSQAQHKVQAEREQWNSKIDGARKRHPDFDAIALNPDLPVAEGSAIDWWVMNSEHGAEVLYHFASNPDQLEALNRMPPLEAAKALAKVEFDMTDAPAPVQRQVPKAPPPPREANTRGQVDPIAAALAAGDFGTYRRLKDAEERGKRS